MLRIICYCDCFVDITLNSHVDRLTDALGLVRMKRSNSALQQLVTLCYHHCCTMGLLDSICGSNGILGK